MGLVEQQNRMKAENKLVEEQTVRGTTDGCLPVGDHTQTILEISLQNEINKIRSLPSLELRAEYKRDIFLPKWLPYAEDYFNKGVKYQNNVVGYCVIYLFDVGDLTQGINLALKAIADGQKLPQHVKRTIPAFVADQIFDWTEHKIRTGNSVQPFFNQIFQNVATEWQLMEIISAKWFKLAAQLLILSDGKAHAAKFDDPERLMLALDLLKHAYTLNHKVQVMSLIERCEMRLKRLHQLGVNLELHKTPPKAGIINPKLPINIERVLELLLAPPLSLDEVLAKQATLA
ncbi:phage terminase small subunit [Mannheimia sp. E30BD]|uniref:phage terminase small subunit n=1 Tax=Mannheimia sp. E30BD TaxID=3278708 RepID=UPI00359D3493